jgi:hypothetical protein
MPAAPWEGFALRLITAAAASALLMSLAPQAATPAGAESVTLKRTGATSRSERARSADEPAAFEESASAADDAPQQNDPIEDMGSDGGGWADAGEDAGSGDASDREPHASTRRLIITGGHTQHTRYKRRRHCVESAWSSCGARTRTLWILD